MDMDGMISNFDADNLEEEMRKRVITLFGSDKPYNALVSRFLAGAMSAASVVDLETFDEFILRMSKDVDARKVLVSTIGDR